MHPILFEIGPIKIFTYGFLLALGFLSAIFVAGREARRLGIPPGKFFDLCFYIILAALVGSRLVYVLLDLRTFIANRFAAARDYLAKVEQASRLSTLPPRRDLELEALGEHHLRLLDDERRVGLDHVLEHLWLGDEGEEQLVGADEAEVVLRAGDAH